MGSFFSSIHLQTSDVDAVLTAARKIAKASGHAMYVANPVAGWTNIYPALELSPDVVAEEIARRVKAAHAISFYVHDSDIFQYSYFTRGKLADSFHSCPDYFGESSEADMAAVGNARAFDGLVAPAQRERLAVLLDGRMIDGETIGAKPDFEDERLAELAQILGIPGVPGNADYLRQGEEAPRVGKASGMTLVGEWPAEDARDSDRGASGPSLDVSSLRSMSPIPGGDGSLVLFKSPEFPEGKAMTMQEVMELARSMESGGKKAPGSRQSKQSKRSTQSRPKPAEGTISKAGSKSVKGLKPTSKGRPAASPIAGRSTKPKAKSKSKGNAGEKPAPARPRKKKR